MTIKTCNWLISALMLCACGNPPEEPGNLQLQLPKGLREISGLTQTANGKLLAVADERAQIYQVDFTLRKAKKFTRFGTPSRKGDFEGIALLDDQLYLVTSDGVLWRQTLGAAPEAYETFSTGLGKRCEVEGLTAWPQRNLLLLLCKQARKKSLRGKLSVFGWSIAEQTLLSEPVVQTGFTAAGLPAISPSGISLSANREHLFIVAAREQYYLEIGFGGRVLRAGKLPYPETHPQTEGVVVTKQNTLYLADEGRKERGRITRYEPSF